MIIQDGTVFPLEFKKTASPDKHDIRHFTVLEKFGMPVGMGGVICLASQALPLDKTAWSVPASLI